jgi:peptidoglycan L-alanyl-D-glutamate endopeptidase CwlK
MSQQLFKKDIKFLQRFLKSGGFDPKGIDGIWGSDTDQAEDAFIAASQALAQKIGTFHFRSEANMMTINLAAQKAAREFLQRVTNAGINARIISGTRTYAEQDAIFAQGRTKPGIRVTDAKGGQSNHNFGIAWDIGIFTALGEYLGDSPLYAKAAEAGLIPGLEWGGNWKKPDKPHFQLATGLSAAATRKKFEKGDRLP